MFDYGVQDLKSARTTTGSGPTVVVRRYGEAIFPVDVVVTFKNGERVTSSGTDATDGSVTPTSGRRRPLSAQVDPERVLLLDVNYTNNSKTLAPRGGGGRHEVVAEVDGLAAGRAALVGLFA